MRKDVQIWHFTKMKSFYIFPKRRYVQVVEILKGSFGAVGLEEHNGTSKSHISTVTNNVGWFDTAPKPQSNLESLFLKKEKRNHQKYDPVDRPQLVIPNFSHFQGFIIVFFHTFSQQLCLPSVRLQLLHCRPSFLHQKTAQRK